MDGSDDEPAEDAPPGEREDRVVDSPSDGRSDRERQSGDTANGRTDSSDDDEDTVEDPMIDAEPDEESVEEPIQSEEDAEEEAAWAAHQWAGIAVVSIAMVLLLALGMLQATGVVSIFAPIVESDVGQWVVFGALVAVVLGALLWSRRGV